MLLLVRVCVFCCCWCVCLVISCLFDWFIVWVCLVTLGCCGWAYCVYCLLVGCGGFVNSVVYFRVMGCVI